MVSKHDILQPILRYCKLHHIRAFYQFEVNVPPRSIGALCDSKYKGQIWLKRLHKSEKRDGTNDRWLYSLADWVDVCDVVIEHQYTTPIREIDLTAH